jgi:hypothetical protein
MRQFGGSEALPDLTELLDDAEPQVQREAVRAILNVGTDAAYRVLEQALAGGTTRSRDAIMQSIGLVRDERATPLFSYILKHIDHRARAGLPARSSRGALRDPGGISRCRPRSTKASGGAAPHQRAARGRAPAARSARPAPACSTKRSPGSRGVRLAARTQLSSLRACRPARARRGRGMSTPVPARRRAAAAVRGVARSAQLYSPGHPIIGRNLESLSAAFQMLYGLQPIVTIIGLVGDEVIVDDPPMAKADTLGPFVRRLQQAGVERLPSTARHGR